MAEGTLNRIDIFNLGNWQTTLNGDAGFPSTSLMIFKPDSLSNEVSTINSNGAYIIRNKVAADAINNQYRLRATKSDGSTEIFYVLSGGTVKTFPDDGQSGYTVQPRGVTIDARAFSLRNVADSADVFAVWNNGRVDINGTDPAFSQFDITGAPAQSAAYMRILTNAAASVFTVNASNKISAAGTADIRNDNHSNGVTEPVLRVFGRQPGQTGDLQQWVDSTNTIRARVFADGTADFNTSTATGATVASAAAGFSLDASATDAVVKAGIVTLRLAFLRTGGNLTASATGNLTDTDLGTIAAAYRPNSFFGSDRMVFTYGTGFTSGAVGLNPSTGLLELLDAHSTSLIETNHTVRVTLTYAL
jgi:hypothetical protein